MVLLRLLQKLPFGQQGQVAFGTLLCLGICAIPVSRKTKAGHDLFSSEKPQEVFDGELKRRRDEISEQQQPPKQ